MSREIHINIIAGLPSEDEPEGYLMAESYYEPERKGNDLADGPYTKQTLDKIVSDVVAVLGGWRKSYDLEIGEKPMFKTPISAEVTAKQKIDISKVMVA